MPRVLEPTTDALGEAAERLASGEVVAFPTETVYGLGGDTRRIDALDRIYSLKGRPEDNPIIAHVPGAEMARELTTEWSDRCAILCDRFWPGPLTLVLPRAGDIPDRATAGRPTIAVRAPRHPVARELLRIFDGPISAPSANRSGHISPTAAHHVAEDFDRHPDLIILDGGPCEVGVESTVLDLTQDLPRVLRPGAVTAREIHDLLGKIEEPRLHEQDASPGTTDRHYAPATPAELIPIAQLLQRLSDQREPAVVICFDRAFVPTPHQAIVMPEGAGMYARRLYEVLREADACGASRILIQEPPTSNDVWKAIHDRLERATTTNLRLG